MGGVFAQLFGQSRQRALDGNQPVSQPTFRSIGQVGTERSTIGLQPDNLDGRNAQDQHDRRAGDQRIEA